MLTFALKLLMVSAIGSLLDMNSHPMASVMLSRSSAFVNKSALLSLPLTVILQLT